ncbi:hypothetical protein F0562_014642 [Nyssa sinensis]|uniref:Uncharacterized protein n=1 Tax=Nyssa sinensis TaxID=561372 RepID=A0A5J4ZRL2_9ASTE|nr:hypothetical protein F0562_014642 [Nyssa sinensis]
MAVVRAPGSLLTAVRFETSNSSNGVPAPRNPDQPLPRLSVSKPSWVVRTESNVQKERRKRPDPPCVQCFRMGNGQNGEVQDLWRKWPRLLFSLSWDWRIQVYYGLPLHEEGYSSRTRWQKISGGLQKLKVRD